MRVVLIVEWLEAQRGGAETSSRQFINHLIDLGVELEVVTRSHVSPRPGMNVNAIRAVGPSRFFKSIDFVRKADRLSRLVGADLVHAITLTPSCDIYQPRSGTIRETIERNLAARRSPIVRSIKRASLGMKVKQRWQLNLERRVLTRSDGPAVVAISEYVARQLKRHYNLADERIHRIFNGVDPDDTPPPERARHRSEIRNMYDIGEDEPLAVMVAHNFQLKGMRQWIEALSRLRNGGSKVRSLVIGGGSIAPWQRLALRHGLSGVLQFTGPTERVRAFYHAADMLVHPTYYDPCSRVVLEAMASGRAVITTRFDGASEVIDHQRSGLVVESPDDVAAIAAWVKRLEEDDAFRRSLGEVAADTAPSFQMRNHAEKMLDLYESLLNEADGSRKRVAIEA